MVITRREKSLITEFSRSEAVRYLEFFFSPCPKLVRDFFTYAIAENSDSLIYQSKLALNKPYGTNIILQFIDAFAISFVRIEAGSGTSLHFHNIRREFFFVRDGILTFLDSDISTKLTSGCWAVSCPGRPHSLQNRGPHPVEIIEVFSPPLLDDKIRVKDNYGRRLGAVEQHE